MDPLCAPTGKSFAFGPFTLMPDRQLLVEDREPIHLGGRALDILAALVERPGELISKRELITRAWPDTFVDEGNLKVNIAALRKALGEAADGSPYIATVTGRGYRFVAPVRAAGSSSAPLFSAVETDQAGPRPEVTASIIGRAQAIAEIRSELDGYRLVAIVGAGGIGKTSVAHAVAERCGSIAPDGVWLIDLAGLTDPALVPNAIAAGISLTAQSANMLAALCDELRERRAVMVLDNCEHLIEAVARTVNRLLAEAPGLRILATTREPLRLGGERLYRLAPLETPPLAARLTAAQAMTFSAVELFVERAKRRHRHFVLDDGNASVVGEICRRLDGLALAIELAATRVDAFGPHELLGLLDHRFQLLRGYRGGPERHLTLTTTIDWSFDLLSEDERAVLRRLSVFTGAFGLDAARAVIGDLTTAFEALANLVAKSLVAAEIRDGKSEYRLLDTTRAYAQAKLVESGDHQDARRRHAACCLEMAEHAGDEIQALSDADWLARHGGKIDEVRAALVWAFDDIANAATGVRLTLAAITLWERLSLVEECRVGVARALEDRFADSRGPRDELALCLALGSALLNTRGPIAAVKAVWERGLGLSADLGDIDGQLRCLWGLSDFHLWTGDLRSALAVADRIRAIAASQKDAELGASVDRQAAAALRYMGDLTAARRHVEAVAKPEARPTFRSGPLRFEFDARLAAQGTLALLLWAQGFPDQAVEVSLRQHGEAQAARHAVSLCATLVHATAPIALYVGDLERAARLLDGIHRHATEHGLTVWNAMAACLRGKCCIDGGDPSGLPLFRKALPELYEGGFRMRYPIYLAAYAEGVAQHEDIDAAHAAIDTALTLAAESGQVWGMSEMVRIKGFTLSREGTPRAMQAAQDRYLEAVDWARRQAALSWELRAVTSLADLWRTSGQESQARQLLSSTLDRFTEGFDTADLRKARALGESLRAH